jgi:hypothetical protein
MPADPQTTKRSPQDIAASVVSDPALFSRWWANRRHSRTVDEAIVRAAEQAALLRRERGLLVLTDAGKALRKAT